MYCFLMQMIFLKKGQLMQLLQVRSMPVEHSEVTGAVSTVNGKSSASASRRKKGTAIQRCRA